MPVLGVTVPHDARGPAQREIRLEFPFEHEAKISQSDLGGLTPDLLDAGVVLAVVCPIDQEAVADAEGREPEVELVVLGESALDRRLRIRFTGGDGGIEQGG